MKKHICTLLLAVIMTVGMAIPAAALTPAYKPDEIKFARINYNAADFADNQPATGNKTSVKGVEWWIESGEWGYLHINWRVKSKAKAYQVELSSDKTFDIADRGQTWRGKCTKRLGAFEMPSGATKYIRVRAVYKNGRVGPWSRTVAVTRK